MTIESRSSPYQRRQINHLATDGVLAKDTSRRGLEFLERSDYRTQHREFTVQEVAITAFDGTKWVVVRAFPLMCM